MCQIILEVEHKYLYFNMKGDISIGGLPDLRWIQPGIKLHLVCHIQNFLQYPDFEILFIKVIFNCCNFIGLLCFRVNYT